jgi:hypothetical protein
LRNVEVRPARLDGTPADIMFILFFATTLVYVGFGFPAVHAVNMVQEETAVRDE